jgi:hypothetical protein
MRQVHVTVPESRKVLAAGLCFMTWRWPSSRRAYVPAVPVDHSAEPEEL